jgi:hypothetical protein
MKSMRVNGLSYNYMNIFNILDYSKDYIKF